MKPIKLTMQAFGPFAKKKLLILKSLEVMPYFN